MTACAIYARKSTEQNDVADEAKSITRQIESARAYAARKGWTVDDTHVYSDDGISGALFGSKRPGLARLLLALRPRPPFQVVVMSEESRLGRESIETGWTLKQITDAGVRVFFYLEDRERTLATAMDKVMLSLTNFASEMEREKARQRTHDALLRKARQGHVPGGACFGYTNEPVFDGERRAHVKRVIEPRQAAVVTRIFEMAAAGTGVKRIAAALNEERVLAPAPRRSARPHTWASSTVRDVLHRELYRGRLVWNRRLRDRGAKHVQLHPKDEWVTGEAPELRIIPEALWLAVHERLAASRAVYLQRTGGHAYGRPVNALESPYLLTGLLSCGACGGSMFMHKHDHGRASSSRRPFYACVVYHQRGRAVCKNNLEVRMESADQAVLKAVERDVLRIEVLETSLAKALDALRPYPDVLDGQAQALRDDLARLDAEVGRLVNAIAAGGELAALMAALHDRERRRAQLRMELATLDRASKRDDGVGPGLLDQLREQLADWQGMLRQEMGPARQALKSLLAGRLIFTPHERDGERYYAFEGPGTVSRIIAGLTHPQWVAGHGGDHAATR